jgi:hypothetical protein
VLVIIIANWLYWLPKLEVLMLTYQKVDAGLAGALDDIVNPEARELAVFIHTDTLPTEEQKMFLRRCGVSEASTEQQVFTATLSAQAVEELTDQSWMRYLRLSSQLHPRK